MRVSPSEYLPDTAVPPGQIIFNIIMGRSEPPDTATLCAAIGIREVDFAPVLLGTLPITPAMADGLAKYFPEVGYDYQPDPVASRTRLWLRLEANYRRALARGCTP